MAFEDIRPYNDEETSRALKRIAMSPVLPIVSKYLFPRKWALYLGHWIRRIETVDSFQNDVMKTAVLTILDRTTSSFTVTGTENLSDKPMLIISNHRDITLDPALLQLALLQSGKQPSELCVGNNLIKRPILHDIMRSNRMIIVRRGITGKASLEAAQELSSYIRYKVAGKERSVWIAQKQGRAKDGIDTTAQGVLKMLSLSGSGNFVDDFAALNIVPMSISYEYEPCDYMKVREAAISHGGIYRKRRGEDQRSIVSGIKNQKGQVCIHFGRPITREELQTIADGKANRNECLQGLATLLDTRIRSGYQCFDTNRWALDMLEGRPVPAEFEKYIEAKAVKATNAYPTPIRKLDKEEMKQMLLHLYANPLKFK